jgi:DNA-binding response OmpR family regulator
VPAEAQVLTTEHVDYSVSTVMKLSFGRCLFDTDARVLTVGGKSRHLTLKFFQLLEILLEQPPRALSKAELHQRIWPGIPGTDGAMEPFFSYDGQWVGFFAGAA